MGYVLGGGNRVALVLCGMGAELLLIVAAELRRSSKKDEHRAADDDG